jgi:hypothetical protein
MAALIAVAALVWGDSLASGFVLMTALLLGAALALPVLLNAVLDRLLRGNRSVLGQWFLADCRQQLPTLSLALMALLLALAANIGAGSMTAGFRQTFSDWLEQRLTAELYLTPQNPAQARQASCTNGSSNNRVSAPCCRTGRYRSLCKAGRRISTASSITLPTDCTGPCWSRPVSRPGTNWPAPTR